MLNAEVKKNASNQPRTANLAARACRELPDYDCREIEPNIYGFMSVLAEADRKWQSMVLYCERSIKYVRYDIHSR